MLTFVAFGGVGKSSLVGRWLDSMAAASWRGARWVFDWSFYSQGTEERVTSADRFLDTALRFFGDPDPQVGAARDRGLRLAELVRREKTLLVLDGIEPLQHSPGHPLAGRLKDPGLAALLKSLAGSNPGLCVVTTRERIADLESFPKTAPQVSLETLSPVAGVELLRQLGVKGKDSELRAVVRFYFQEELEKERPQAWQEGNLRLYEYLKAAAPEFPETLEAMEPLFAAVIHGCRAGRQQEAMEEVYWRRARRDNENYNAKALGAYGSELAALVGFFDPPWNSPSVQLETDWQALALDEAAFCLRALGRLAEAVPPMRAALERHEKLEDWKNAALCANNLGELTLTLGEVQQAVGLGELSVSLADRCGDIFQRIARRTALADALHQEDRRKESAEAFRAAEAMQAEWQPEYSQLYSLRGYLYCDLLLSCGEPEDGTGLDGVAAAPEEGRRFRQICQEVRERAGQTLEWAIRGLGPLPIALDHLSLGRAQLGLALTDPVPTAPGEEADADFAKAAEHLNCAVEGLRQAGTEHYMPRGLLARAEMYRLRGNRTAAEADLSEALEIAEQGGMRLYACDAHLEWARLELQKGDTAAARGHVAVARKLVNKTGYRRREREVAWLERRLGVTGAPPS